MVDMVNYIVDDLDALLDRLKFNKASYRLWSRAVWCAPGRADPRTRSSFRRDRMAHDLPEEFMTKNNFVLKFAW
jgi:hypothetical protein